MNWLSGTLSVLLGGVTSLLGVHGGLYLLVTGDARDDVAVRRVVTVGGYVILTLALRTTVTWLLELADRL